MIILNEHEARMLEMAKLNVDLAQDKLNLILNTIFACRGITKAKNVRVEGNKILYEEENNE